MQCKLTSYYFQKGSIARTQTFKIGINPTSNTLVCKTPKSTGNRDQAHINKKLLSGTLRQKSCWFVVKCVCP